MSYGDPNFNDVDRLISYMESTLNLDHLTLPAEFRYAHLSLALIDAVFSIGIKYTVTQRVVANYARFRGLAPYRSDEDRWPDPSEQEPLSHFLELGNTHEPEQLASDIFQNHNRTSSTHGILKAEAVMKAAQILTAHHVEYFQDLPKISQMTAIEETFCAIPGQKKRLSWVYFWMLAGTDQMIKPDRHVLRYLNSALNRQITGQEAQYLIQTAAEQLQSRYPKASPRRLDYTIWTFQRQH
ncbi:hypothetical protein [Sulfobacillus thermosulfidooxidans]|uniref:hypothetical protein n=1 Tax=Sulfobacillus thermosulfidooxidans TaxID=28034 RepID=UPI0004120EAF|nr:hypothetical protein [Sulfobacillus thermosulfidooxidans]